MSLSHLTIQVFCSFAPGDEQWVRELEIHLGGLKQQGLISLWHNMLVVPGTNRTEVINQQLKQASIILLLMSPNFLACDHCYQVEMMNALKRLEEDKSLRPRVIPIIVRPCIWDNTPIANLQHLPDNEKAISTWDNQELAWNNVVKGISKAIEDLHRRNIPQRTAPNEQPNFPHIDEFQQTKPSSRRPFKLLFSLPLIVSVVAVAIGGFWFWTAHNQAFQYPSYQKISSPTASSMIPNSTIVSSSSSVKMLAAAKAMPIVYKDTMNNLHNQDTAAATWDITTQCSFSQSGYQTSTYTLKPAFCHERNKIYQNAFISVDVAIIGGGSAGLLFRDQFFSNASGAYLFEVGSNGQYKISTAPFAVQSTLKNWTQASAIHIGQGVKNTLQVIAQNNSLFFFINGSFLTEIQDGRYRNGSISFACYTGTSSETEAIFSNLEIHKLP